MNKAAIIGRLANGGVQFNDDFDGDPKCRFKLAVTERWQDKERTELVNIFVAGRDAEKMRVSRTGDLVFVKGMPRTGKYQQDGENIYYLEIESRQLTIIRENQELTQEGLDQNEVTLVGRLGQDPKLFSDGKVASFSLACEEYNGRAQHTQWLNVTTFDTLAKSAGQFLTKGRLVAVEGKVRTREYEKDGEIKSATSIVASKWKALDARPKGSDGKSQDPSPSSTGDVPPW